MNDEDVAYMRHDHPFLSVLPLAEVENILMDETVTAVVLKQRGKNAAEIKAMQAAARKTVVDGLKNDRGKQVMMRLSLRLREKMERIVGEKSATTSDALNTVVADAVSDTKFLAEIKEMWDSEEDAIARAVHDVDFAFALRVFNGKGVLRTIGNKLYGHGPLEDHVDHLCSLPCEPFRAALQEVLPALPRRE